MLNKFFQQFDPEDVEYATEVSEQLLSIYQEQVAIQHIQYDEAQVNALQEMQKLMLDILMQDAYATKSGTQKFFISAPEKCKSLYLFGGVGRGKTMLMDMFYDACPIQQKRRVHFHAFMQEVHSFTHQWRKQQHHGEVIPALAKKIRAQTLLLCFDEFHVTDIADAMILGRLFGQLFDLGIVIVATSNRHPDDLYQNGLQRELFVPFIERLKQTANVIELVAREDYRLLHLQAMEVTYYSPIDAHANEFLLQSYNELTVFAPMQPGVLHVLGRKIKLSVVHGDIAMTSFEELCAQPLGAPGYLEIACEFTTLIMADIPLLTEANRNEAKRFTILIDALYEQKVNFICTAAVAPQELYAKGDGAFEFQRTASRLIEMQSQSYLANR